MIKNMVFNRLGLSLGVAFSLAMGFSASAIAQYEADQGQQSNEKSGIYGDAPSGLDPLEIMHRAQQNNGRSAAEFNADSQTQLDNSALDFKRLQQQRILEQQQSQQNKTGVEAEATEVTDTVAE